VQLVQHGFRQRDAAPRVVGPRERARIDQLRFAVDAVRLGPGRRIGERAATVDPIPVTIAGAEIGEGAAETSVVQSLEVASAAILEHQLDAFRLRSPHTELPAIRLWPGTDARRPEDVDRPLELR
jgi:hypothetical protein